MVWRPEMSTSAAFLFKTARFEKHSSCIESACLESWGSSGPMHRGHAPDWTIIRWSAGSEALLKSVHVENGDDSLLAGLTILPFPESATRLFVPCPERHTFIAATIEKLQRCDAWLNLGIWLFPLRGSRRAPPLKRFDEPFAIRNATHLETNCAYTQITLSRE